MMIHAIAMAVILQMNNVARAPAADLERAERGVTRLFHDIGVDLTWTASDASPATAPPSIRVVLVPYEAGDLRRRPRVVMGAAVVTEQGTRVAYVFYQQVEAQARQYEVSSAMILASAIAHEVGHLLLPDGQHSPGGLMRACWTRDDFHRAEQGRLQFSTEQAALIRGRAASSQPLVEHESRHRAGQ